jgi:hypothetical protein
MTVDLSEYDDHIRQIERGLAGIKEAIKGSYDVGWNAALEKAIDKLNDLATDSANFRRVYGSRATGALYVCGQQGGCRDPGTSTYVCGQVNAKNRLGGYTGFSWFSVTTSGRVWVEDQNTPASVVRDGPSECR